MLPLVHRLFVLFLMIVGLFALSFRLTGGPRDWVALVLGLWVVSVAGYWFTVVRGLGRTDQESR